MKPFDPCDRATWPEVLTRAQVAAIWQRGEDRIYRLVREGMFRPMPMGSEPGMRWSKSAVTRYLDGQQRRTA